MQSGLGVPFIKRLKVLYSYKFFCVLLRIILIILERKCNGKNDFDRCYLMEKLSERGAEVYPHGLKVELT